MDPGHDCVIVTEHIKSFWSPQCHSSCACGAVVCTLPNVCISSWPGMRPTPSCQHARSTRENDSPSFGLYCDGRSSTEIVLIPQYDFASPRTKYFRSARFNPSLINSLTMVE